MKICFLVGSMAISGGTYVILQHASYLRRHGFDVSLAVQYPIIKGMLDWHDEIKNIPIFNFAQAKLENFDLVIATWWDTAFHLQYFNSTYFGYFIQSIESRFFTGESQAELRNFVEQTYRLPVAMITEATWIQKYLRDNYNQNAALVKNGIRKDIYNTISSDIFKQNNIDKPSILVEGPFGVSFKNTAYAINLARKAGVKSISVLTSTPVKYLPYVNHLYSQIPMMQTPRIYRSCDILLKLSSVEGMFGPPLEMFHCGGTAIIFNVSGYDEYIIDNYNARVAQLENSDQVIQIIQELLSDQAQLLRLKQNALVTAQNWPDWSESSQNFMKWVDSVLSGTPQNRAEIADISECAKENFRARQVSIKTHIVKQFIMGSGLRRLANGLRHRLKRIFPFQPILEIWLGGKKCY